MSVKTERKGKAKRTGDDPLADWGPVRGQLALFSVRIAAASGRVAKPTRKAA